MTSCSDERVRLWDVMSGALAAQALAPGRKYPIAAIDPAGRWLAVAAKFGTTLYEIQHPAAYNAKTTEDDILAAIEYAPGSRDLAAISEREYKSRVFVSRLQFWDDQRNEIRCQTRVSTHVGHSQYTFRPIASSFAFDANSNVVWGSSQASLLCRRSDRLPEPTYITELGPLGGAVLEEDSFKPVKDVTRCEIRSDPLAANGKAMRLAPQGAIDVQLNWADLDALEPAFACYAIIRVEGTCGDKEVFAYAPYIDGKRVTPRQVMGVDIPSPSYHVYRVDYEVWPSSPLKYSRFA
jgi:hypothetical protein